MDARVCSWLLVSLPLRVLLYRILSLLCIPRPSLAPSMHVRMYACIHACI